MPQAIPFIALAITAASAGFSVKSQLDSAAKQKKARKRQLEAQREAERIKQVRSDVETRKERRKQLREARIRKAQILSASTLAGSGGDTSTTVGALGSVNTQLGAGVGAQNEARGFGEALSQQAGIVAAEESKIAAAQGQDQVNQAIAGGVNQISSIGENIFARFGGTTSTEGGNTFDGNSLFEGTK